MFQRLQVPRFQIGLADVLFVFYTLAIMQHATHGMMDDPGLGWHLRIPDLMVEEGGFVYEEHFSFPTAGNPWITRAWLSDIIMRVAYGWGGLNAVALLTCMVVALTMRLVYRRLEGDGFHWGVAAAATLIGVLGLTPSFVARPNIVSFLGVWLVADLCQRFHAGKISHRRLFWLVPIMLLWTNMHGGFMAGLVLLAIAWAVEAGLAVFSWKPKVRAAARQRLLWVTAVGFVAGLATLINPNGIGLHFYNLQSVTDPFIQNNTTIEWRPPDFKLEGWFNIERLILALPLLAATCRRRVNLVGLAMTVAWLHFALTSRRYSTLWVVIAMPTLCELAVYNPWLQHAVRQLRRRVSDGFRQLMLPAGAGPGTSRTSWLAAAALLVCSAWMPQLAGHDPARMPAASLDRFLDFHHGEPTFHSANWGGYLTWKGWEKEQRFKTWIDDRIEVHGKQHTIDYYEIIQAEPDWRRKLDRQNVELICIPLDVRLATELKTADDWQACFVDEYLAVYRRREPRTGNVAAR